MFKFWNFQKNEEPDEFGSERELRLNGPIAEESWWGDEVTPAAFREELNAGSGDITVWINSPGGDVFAGAEIYTMLKRVSRQGHGQDRCSRGICSIRDSHGRGFSQDEPCGNAHDPQPFNHRHR